MFRSPRCRANPVRQGSCARGEHARAPGRIAGCADDLGVRPSRLRSNRLDGILGCQPRRLDPSSSVCTRKSSLLSGHRTFARNSRHRRWMPSATRRTNLQRSFAKTLRSGPACSNKLASIPTDRRRHPFMTSLSRRRFVSTCAASALPVPLRAQPTAPAFDLVIRGGIVSDPARGLQAHAGAIAADGSQRSTISPARRLHAHSTPQDDGSCRGSSTYKFAAVTPERQALRSRRRISPSQRRDHLGERRRNRSGRRRGVSSG